MHWHTTVVYTDSITHNLHCILLLNNPTNLASMQKNNTPCCPIWQCLLKQPLLCFHEKKQHAPNIHGRSTDTPIYRDAKNPIALSGKPENNFLVQANTGTCSFKLKLKHPERKIKGFQYISGSKADSFPASVQSHTSRAGKSLRILLSLGMQMLPGRQTST